MGRRAMNFIVQNLQLTQGTFCLRMTDLIIPGQVIGIFGASGAGKTTFLEVVAGLRRPAAGQIQVDGLCLMDGAKGTFLPPDRRGVGYVPQDLALFPHLSVKKNLSYARSPAASARINPAHVFEILDIASLLDRAVSDLSGGQKQRVAFGRALLSSPRLLLMDEPLASLDHELKLALIPYLKRIRDDFKIPMLYVSHSPDEIVELCDQVMVMRDGKCLRISPPGELFETSASMTLKPGIYDSCK
jgi:molybdate transport system ATP-binding protein